LLFLIDFLLLHCEAAKKGRELIPPWKFVAAGNHNDDGLGQAATKIIPLKNKRRPTLDCHLKPTLS